MEEILLEKQRLTYIDLLKSIAIFLVLMYHSTLYGYDFLAENSVLNYFLYFIRTILSACVPLFFFANGYLLFGKDFNLRKHILKMIKLVFITVIWGVITLLLLQVIRQEYFSLIDFIRYLWRWEQGWINHLWYMGALVCIYVFFPILKNVYDTNIKVFYYFTAISALFTFGNTLINHAGAIGINFISAESFEISGINFFNMFNPFRGLFGYTFVYFCTGGIIHHFKDKIEAIPAKKRNIISILGMLFGCIGLWVLGILYSKTRGAVWDVVWNGYDTIFTFFNVIFIYALCLNWKKDARLVRTISSNTLGIYFIHYIIIRLFKPYLVKYEFLTNFSFNVVFVIFVLIVCLILCFILRKIPVVSKLVK